ncbi:hypothetical protein AB1Y20_000793 [Prymnesium parvum]|uniref:Uncharacterized protein n=1 Tax=Prymnesium parvum TaxID=97485 RepID=A0AB34K9K1_PRYPA
MVSPELPALDRGQLDVSAASVSPRGSKTARSRRSRRDVDGAADALAPRCPPSSPPSCSPRSSPRSSGGAARAPPPTSCSPRAAATHGADLSAAQLVHAAACRSIHTTAFAHAIAARRDDLEWLEAVGEAIGELGALVHSASHDVALQQQKAMTLAARRAELGRQRQLDQAIEERDAARAQVKSLRQAVHQLQDEMEFLAIFPSTAEMVEEHGGMRPYGRLAHEGRQRGMASMKASGRSMHMSRTSGNSVLPPTSSPFSAARSGRAERVKAMDRLHKQRDQEIEARMQAIQRNHQQELNELREQIKTLEHDHRAEFESREKARQEAYRNTAIHMKTCSREKKLAFFEKDRAKAMASAAVDVLLETQTEAKSLRRQLEGHNLKIQMDGFEEHTIVGMPARVDAADVMHVERENSDSPIVGSLVSDLQADLDAHNTVVEMLDLEASHSLETDASLEDEAEDAENILTELQGDSSDVNERHLV